MFTKAKFSAKIAALKIIQSHRVSQPSTKVISDSFQGNKKSSQYALLFVFLTMTVIYASCSCGTAAFLASVTLLFVLETRNMCNKAQLPVSDCCLCGMQNFGEFFWGTMQGRSDRHGLLPSASNDMFLHFVPNRSLDGINSCEHLPWKFSVEHMKLISFVIFFPGIAASRWRRDVLWVFFMFAVSAGASA